MTPRTATSQPITRRSLFVKRIHPAYIFCVLALVCGVAAAESQGVPPRALPTGSAPNDARLQPLKDFGGHFPFTPPDSPAEWEKRAAKVRQRILVALGLWPMPTLPAFQPVIHGRVDCGDYTVEKVFFESAPGFFVTGNLYRPSRIAGKVPGVLVAHGHNRDNPSARMEERDDETVRQEIGRQEERFENAARNRYQAIR
jgi:hypothetical protein